MKHPQDNAVKDAAIHQPKLSVSVQSVIKLHLFIILVTLSELNPKGDLSNYQVC